MVGPNKILTVSYGTFSCTLEGFDDPFGTMRGIAEYFRDLAADDRYFGAEPPTPDAEMLHRIAEKEIQRRVEARVEGNGLILRQADDTPREEAASRPLDSTDQAPEPVWSPEESTDAHFEAPEAKADAPVSKTETVAEKLARIRAVVAQGSDEYEDAPGQAATQDTASELEIAAEFMAGSDTDEVEEDETVGEVDTAPEAETEGEGEAHAEPEAEVVAATDAEAQSDDEDLSLAVASDESQDHIEEDDTSSELDDLAIANVLASASEDEAEADASGEETEEDETDVSVASSDFADLIAREIEAANNGEAAEPKPEPAPQDNVSRLLKMRLSDFKASVSAQTDSHEEMDVAQEPTDDAPEAPLILSDDMQDGVADATSADDTDDEFDLSRETVSEISTLSEEDEADLMASLAAVDDDQDNDENEETTAQAPETVEQEQPAPEEQEIAAAPEQHPVPRPEGVKVARLLEVTNNELAESESSRRRSAIAHLKAAVAATRAERQAAVSGEAGTKAERDSMNAYRDDLAHAVRTNRTEDRPRTEPRRLPPLVLVSEQRVDLNRITQDAETRSEPHGSVLPRRIVSEGTLRMQEDDEADNIFSESGSFSEFAREMGATELPDLLEAAAAYYHYVEGQPHFSRPQIMNAVATLNDSGDFSREEGLRSFGILLRRGKIRKIRRGQFEIAEDTRFRPELRAGE